MVTVFASKTDELVRVQAWHGRLSGKAPTLCTSFEIDAVAAEKLIVQLREALDAMPRVGTPADLGCTVL